MILILVSFESKKDAERVANYLVDNKLAACVEFFPVQSTYIWDNKKVSTQEFSGVVKTTDGNFEKVKSALEKVLSYEIPQIIRLEASANESYLNWVKKSAS